MPGETEAYRQRVIDALSRMADIEEGLMNAADSHGDTEGAEYYEHGMICLLEALDAVKGIPHV